jgi:hypothetical protein
MLDPGGVAQQSGPLKCKCGLNGATQQVPGPLSAMAVLAGMFGARILRGTPLTLLLYVVGSRMRSAAASPFRGSFGLGYSSSWGKKTSNTLTRSAHTAGHNVVELNAGKENCSPNIGLHVWLMTSRQTDPALRRQSTSKDAHTSCMTT